MNDYWQVRIHSEDNPEKWIRETVETLDIQRAEDGTTLLATALPDVSAVFGLLLQLRDMQISLICLQVDHIEGAK